MGNGMRNRVGAVILAAGSGRRMGSDIPKQYLDLKGKPVLYYSLAVFEESDVDEIILVVGKEDMTYCQEHIVSKYNIKKVKKIVTGGEERYLSVYQGLQAISSCEYVLIHDGARPFITKDLIKKCIEEVQIYKAAIVGVPVKDTVKIVGEDGVVISTPDRKSLWNIQTPQCFELSLIIKAYDIMMERQKAEDVLADTNYNPKAITDDAMVVEHTTGHPIHIIMGSYENIKITTKEDLKLGKSFLEEK